MGGATFLVKAEDMMNLEDFVTLLICCPESLLDPFVGVGAAQFISQPASVFLEAYV